MIGEKKVLDRCEVEFTRNFEGIPSGYYLYVHRKATDGSIFYVGKGLRDRWKSTNRTNKHWQNTATKHGVIVDILIQDLQEWYAYEKEIELIAYYGREDLGEGQLVNHDNGGEGGGKPCETEVYTFANFSTGESFKGTKNQFKEAIGFHPYSLVKIKDHQRIGWYLVGNVSQDKLEKYSSGFSRCSDEVYSFVNFKTGQELTTTISKFKKETNVNPAHIISGRKNSNHGWTTKEMIEKVGLYKIQNPFYDKYDDAPIYEFYNFDLKLVHKGTRQSLAKKYNVDIAFLFSKTNDPRISHNWCLLEHKEAVKDFDAVKEHTFKHKDGRTFTGTRRKFKAELGVDPESLFYTKKCKTCQGWYLV